MLQGLVEGEGLLGIMSQEEARNAARVPSLRMLMRQSRRSGLQHLRLPWLMTLPLMCATEPLPSYCAPLRPGNVQNTPPFLLAC